MNLYIYIYILHPAIAGHMFCLETDELFRGFSNNLKSVFLSRVCVELQINGVEGLFLGKYCPLKVLRDIVMGAEQRVIEWLHTHGSPERVGGLASKTHLYLLSPVSQSDFIWFYNQTKLNNLLQMPPLQITLWKNNTGFHTLSWCC